MPKRKNSKPYTLYVFHIPLLALVLAVFISSALVARNYSLRNGDSASVLGKGNNKSKPDNSNKGQGKNANPLKGLGKPEDTGPKVDNAAIHRQNVQNALKGLYQTAQDEEGLGNDEVAEDLEGIIDEELLEVEGTVDAIEEIETRNKWQNLLFGTDYKNLGQLRSSMVRTQNQIRKLEKNENKFMGTESNNKLQESMQVLTAESERMRAIIESNEEQFSVLGWVVKLLTGYESTPLGGIDIDDVVDGVSESTESTEATGSMDTE